MDIDNEVSLRLAKSIMNPTAVTQKSILKAALALQDQFWPESCAF